MNEPQQERMFRIQQDLAEQHFEANRELVDQLRAERRQHEEARRQREEMARQLLETQQAHERRVAALEEQMRRASTEPAAVPPPEVPRRPLDARLQADNDFQDYNPGGAPPRATRPAYVYALSYAPRPLADWVEEG